MTIPQISNPPSTNWAVQLNQLMLSVGQGFLYGHNERSDSGLDVALIGVNAEGNTITDVVVTCANNATNYIVALRASYALSDSTATTNWTNTATYGRVGIAVFAAGVLTSYTDARFEPGGLFDHGSGSAAVTSVNGLTGAVDIGVAINAATGKTTPVDADSLGLSDSAASNVLKKLTWANLKATVKTYFDTLYQVLDSDLTTIAGLTATTDNFLQSASSAWASRTPAQAVVSLQGAGLDVDMAGFRGVPINSQSGNYTTVAADNGKTLLHPSGAGAGDTFTIDSNANVAHEIGAAITFCNMATDALSIAITSDTMNLAGAGTTGTRTLAQYGIATALKVTTTGWLISGTNLT